jgi:hypothetical protein
MKKDNLLEVITTFNQDKKVLIIKLDKIIFVPLSINDFAIEPSIKLEKKELLYVYLPAYRR